ncbi:MAG: hydrogenase maturation nickel metallochaperone HypA, partial [Bacteroidota bacterium]
ILENAKLIIHELEGVVSCNHCKTEFTTNTIFDPCPHCGKFGNTILKGQEMFVKTLRSGD